MCVRADGKNDVIQAMNTRMFSLMAVYNAYGSMFLRKAIKHFFEFLDTKIDFELIQTSPAEIMSHCTKHAIYLGIFKRM